MLISRDWLTDYLGDKTPTAAEIERLLTYHSFEIEGVEQVGDDDVIDVDVLPNRSSDCLCHRGIARELATLLNQPLTNDPLTTIVDLPASEAISVSIADTVACPRFTASLVTGIEVKESPDWLKRRLEALGQRPINNIVDATNYVMFAIGQPIHAYDADLFPQVDGKWQFGVRFAKEGEVVSLIAEGGKDEDRDVELVGTELLIVDESNDTPIGLAGVKGGRYAGVHAGTTKVIIEAAHFNPTVTRQTARRLGIVIDASKRFENEPARELPSYAQHEIMDLIMKIAGGEYQGMVDVYSEIRTIPEVMVRPERANALLGLTLSVDEMESILKRMGAETHMKREGILCQGPFERTDLVIEEDFIEEIGRIHGYDDVESVVPDTVPLSEVNIRHYYSEKIRDSLVALGFNEVITSSFRKKDKLKLANALASDKQYMRSALRKNIDDVLTANIAHVDLIGAQDVRVFEIGTVFDYDKDDKQITESISLVLGVRTKASGYTSKDDPKLAEAVQAVSEILGGTVSFVTEQGTAELSLSDYLPNLKVPAMYESAAKSVDLQYQPFSVYPSMSRDIALWVGDDVLAGDVETVLNEHAGMLRVRTTLFDEFQKDGRTSYAFRLVFQAHDRTLTDEEVNAEMESVNAAVTEKNWEIR